MSSIVPVLLYHSVADVPPAGCRRYTVSRANFAEHVEAVVASGRVALSVSELAAGLRGERALPERAVAITFDDGFADTTDAVNGLLRRGLPSTVYVTVGDLGTRDRLTHAGLAELARLPGVEIGAHAVRHRRLDELDGRELAEEVRLSKVRLGQLTESPVASFAYPHGAYDPRVRREVIAAGYRSAAAVKNALSHAADDPFAIARWTVTDRTDATRVTSVLEGEGVPRAWAAERFRTRASRTVRRGRNRLAGTLGSRR